MNTPFIPLSSDMLEDVSIEHTENYLRLVFDRPRQVLSNAVYNGGSVWAKHIINLKVVGDLQAEPELPRDTFYQLCDLQGWDISAIGLMTAASMKSARLYSHSIEGEQLAVLVTTGIANARRAGDLAEFRQLDTIVRAIGTINTVVLCTARLSSAAMCEAMMVATEAKAAVLQDMDIRSPILNKIATGTGTDALVVVSGNTERQINYVGKHTLMGETLAKLVIAATGDSLQYKIKVLEQQLCG